MSPRESGRFGPDVAPERPVKSAELVPRTQWHLTWQPPWTHAAPASAINLRESA